MKRPHWQNDLYRDKKYLLDRNETCDPEFSTHLRSFLNALPIETLTTYPSMSKAYNSLIKLASVPGKNLFLTSGSEQGIKTILENNISIKKLVFPEPTFKMVEVYANLLYFDYEKMPYRYEFNKFDIDLNFNSDAIIYIASPDNPTGFSFGSSFVEQLCQTHPLVILDEAYSPHAAARCKLIEKYDNLYIVRTFSKFGSAAGLRIGYIISAENNINRLYMHKPMYELSNIAVEYLHYMSNNIDLLQKSTENIANGKQKLEGWLRSMNCKVVNYVTGNFVLFERNDTLTSKIKEYVAYKNVEVDGKEFTRITAPSVDCVNDIITYAT
ncbi:aminotransferase class I/II-fold pyridoxal phosphate-dependent enzyme [bacterium]|nr:aminotransferase class I/II-fold pyridoxal phosphate-dependent enzyme [bacterium]